MLWLPFLHFDKKRGNVWFYPLKGRKLVILAAAIAFVIVPAGILLHEFMNNDEAVNYLETAATDMNDNLRLHYNLAQLYAFLGRDAEAEKEFKYISGKAPGSVEYIMAIVDFCLSREAYEKALPYVRRISQLCPNDTQFKQLVDFVNSKLPSSE